MKVRPACSTRSTKPAFSERKPYPGMDGLRPADLGGEQDRGLVQVALPGAAGPMHSAWSACAHIDGLAVGFGVDSHRAQPQAAAGALDAQRDLAAIRNQDGVEHRSHLRQTAAAAARLRLPGPK